MAESVRPLIKIDEKLEALELGPIFLPARRYFIKNKSIFPLMKEKQVVFFTLLEGEIIRGVIASFRRYEITVNVKGGIPVTILRHSVYDLRDKKDALFSNPFRRSTRIGKRANFSSLKALFKIVIVLRDCAGVIIAVRREESLMREGPDLKGEVLPQLEKLKRTSPYSP